MTDITYIRTQEGFAYLAVVIDLFSRRVVGPFRQPALHAPSGQRVHAVTPDDRRRAPGSAHGHMAKWRRKPKAEVLIHSDQGSQFTSMDWAFACSLEPVAFTRSLLKTHDLEHSMSRRGNCHEFKPVRASGENDPGDHLQAQNAVAESFFNLLKRERIRRRTYRPRQDARRDVFDYIEMFYTPKRKHARNGMLSPVEFERQQKLIQEGVHDTRGYSGSR